MASTTLANSAGYLSRSMVEQIVRQVALEYLGKQKGGSAPQLSVQSSSRHMHVCREDMDILFGPGSELTFDRPLFQEGNFAAKETVTIVGPRSRLISNFRILGQRNLPPSSFFAHTQSPLPSYTRSFRRLRRAFVKTNTWPLSGSQSR